MHFLKPPSPYALHIHTHLCAETMQLTYARLQPLPQIPPPVEGLLCTQHVLVLGPQPGGRAMGLGLKTFTGELHGWCPQKNPLLSNLWVVEKG